jgi:hypothetical protein
MSSIVTKENLRRKNFAPEEFLNSVTATKLGIKNIPNLNQLTAGLRLADKMQELYNAIEKVLLTEQNKSLIPFFPWTKKKSKAAFPLQIIISSGFRNSELNKAVKGSPNSWHMQFLACDFNIVGMTPINVVLSIKKSGVSVDKCFVERSCVHMQTAMHDSENRNEFGTAELKNGVWKVTKDIRAI